MGSSTARSLDREPAALAMRIGVVAAEAALATFARNLDLDDLEDGIDFQGAIGPAEWPVFSLVIDTLAEAGPGDRRTLDGFEVRAMKQKIDDNQPTEFPSAVVGLMKALWKPMVEGMVIDWNNKEQDDARVPAGVFKHCYQAYTTVSFFGSSQTTRNWAHPAVPMSGSVRSQSTDSTFSMVLLEFGLEGATSEIGI